jgi:F-type H+-transporting ATPase subunit b
MLVLFPSFPILAALVDLDRTFFIQLGIFLVFLVVLNQVLFKPLLRLFERRAQATAGRKEEAAAAAEEAKRIKAGCDARVSEASAQGAAGREASRLEARKEETRMLDEAAAEATRAHAEGVAAARAACEQERAAIKDRAREISDDIVASVLGGAR